MATYKVIQDIEADDKFVGPLTLKQFVFAMAGAFFAYLSFFAITKGFPYALILFVPPMLLGFFLAVPWSKHQPTEVWVLAKLKFMLVPRKRIWDQTGMEELVTITAPKKEEKHLTDDLSQTEVKSRLQALAQTIDSRGWAVKDIAQNANLQAVNSSVDRLVDTSILPANVPIMDTSTLPDLYDYKNETASNFDRMIQQSNQLHHDQSLEIMNHARTGEPLTPREESNFHITPPPTNQAFQYSSQSVDEDALTEELKHRRAPGEIATSHMRKVSPINKKHKSSKKKPKEDEHNSDQKEQKNTVPTPNQTAILGYASNNDLNVATIARQAKKDTEDDEVVISLR